MIQFSNAIGLVERDTSDYVNIVRGSQESFHTSAGVNEEDGLDDVMEKWMYKLTFSE